MRRLQTTNINSPEFFDEAYFGRLEKHGVDFCQYDKERYDRMAEKFTSGVFLDLGVGDSPICVDLEKKTKGEYHALDFAKRIMEYLGKKYPQVKYVHGDVLNTCYEDETFDYVVMGELLEHMDSPQNLIKEAMRILKPNGTLALSTPYKEDFTKEGFISPEHMWSFDRQDVGDLLKPYGKVDMEIYKKENHPKILAWCKRDGK